MDAFFQLFTFQSGNPLQFNSMAFFVLFSLFYLIYAFTTKQVVFRNMLLLVFSLFFYYKIGNSFVFLLIAMATSDFFIGKGIASTSNNRKRNLLLALSLTINLGSLLFFKYTQFFLDSWLGFTAQSPINLHIIQPIGISFFVFKTLTYIFDVHREMIEEPERNYVNYLLYVSFFPTILAGPIAKARNLLPQFNQPVTITEKHVGRGLFLIMSGLFYKIAIADFLAANFVDRVFDAPIYFSGLEAAIAALGAMFQIYYDFAGYTNMVLGMALLLGFEIEPNFNQPFLAKNITDFWRRWHITLSTWFNEYLFTPLSFSMRSIGKAGAVIAVLITFFVSGFWHGAAWTYILWGVSHGIAIAWDTTTQRGRKQLSSKIPKFIYNPLSIILTLIFLSLSVVLFKSADLTKAAEVYTMIFTKLDISLIGQWATLYFYPCLVLILAIILHYLPKTWTEKTISLFTRMHWSVKVVAISIFTILIYQVYISASQPFIYLIY
jgi:alginate O-acetyltransferase complex protein AlgI